MDETFLSWLLLIPGLTRKQAELLAATFPTVQALRTAGVTDLVAAGGLDEDLARRVKEYAETAAPGSDRLYRGETGLYLCPECGALIAKDAAKCRFCGTTFEGEEEGAAHEELAVPERAATPADRLQPEGQALTLCPNCGAFVGRDAAVCVSCGVVLEGEEAAEAAPVAAPEDRLQKEGQGLFLCPSCGAIVGADATACPRCGTSLEGEEAGPPAAAAGVAQ